MSLSAQNSLFSDRTYRRGVNLFFAYVALLTAIYGLLTARLYRSWTIADWLINYEGGFIRRGLPGQAAYELGHLFHRSPVDFAVLFYLATYAVLLVCARALALRATPQWWCVALLLSPGTFSFQVLDATGGFRKEILFLAALALLLFMLRREWLPPLGIVVFLTLAVCVSVLSHESLICYAPYLLAALLLSGRSFRQSAQQFALPLAAGLALAFVCSRHHGDLSAATEICRSLGYRLGPQSKQVCGGGSIAYLTYSSEMARARTWERVWGDLYFVVYPLATALALLPLLLGSKALARSGFQREVRAVWITAAVAFLCSLVLFAYAEDWGRWIYIHILSLSLLLLYLDGQRRSRVVQEQQLAPALLPARRQTIAAWSLAAYATLWSLPHVPSQTLPFGYLGLGLYVLRHLGV